MKQPDIVELVSREPFRPFKIRLSNGTIYRFPTVKFLGASQDGRLIYWFGPKGEAVRIDTEAITEVSEGTKL